MKNLILIIILAIAGYYAYQYFYVPAQESTVEDSSPGGMDTYVPPVPEACQDKAREYENGVYSADSPRTSFAQRNYAKRAFMTCLKDAGFSDEQVGAKLTETEEKVKGWVKQDGGVTW